jgi:hypothetical protein
MISLIPLKLIVDGEAAGGIRPNGVKRDSETQYSGGPAALGTIFPADRQQIMGIMNPSAGLFDSSIDTLAKVIYGKLKSTILNMAVSVKVT